MPVPGGGAGTVAVGAETGGATVGKAVGATTSGRVAAAAAASTVGLGAGTTEATSVAVAPMAVGEGAGVGGIAGDARGAPAFLLQLQAAEESARTAAKTKIIRIRLISFEVQTLIG